MLAREPIPPPPADKSPADDRSRTLHTMLQMPREARWSRPSSVLLSIVVHLALFLAIRQLVWVKPSEDKGPVFQIFQLSTPKEVHTPIAAPVITPPVTKNEEDRVREETPAVRTAPPPAAGVPVPALTEPSVVPGTLPEPGAAAVEPSLTNGRSDGAPRTAADRLLRSGTASPGYSLTAPGAPPAPLTAQQQAAARMARGMQSINDSIFAAEAAANSATDWTKTDKNGNKWGFTPGQLHLGSITLPFPVYFNTPPGRREDAAKSARTFSESNAQAKRMEVEETFESRVKAMRKRKDAERDSARAHGGGH